MPIWINEPRHIQPRLKVGDRVRYVRQGGGDIRQGAMGTIKTISTVRAYVVWDNPSDDRYNRSGVHCAHTSLELVDEAGRDALVAVIKELTDV